MTNLRYAIPLSLCLLSASLPAASEPPSQGLPFSAFLTEGEMRLMFDYMRDAIIAAMRGEEYAMPPELAHKLAQIQQRLMEEGNASVRQMMEMMQRDLDRALERMKPPPAPAKPERTGT